MLVHRVLLGIVLLGNTVAFAGIDPPTRLVTAGLALWLAFDVRRTPAVPRLHRAAGVLLLAVVVVQLVPLPAFVRHFLQPGLAEVMHAGWAPLSLAPWSTVQVLASAIIAVLLAATAARMAATRTGLPMLLIMLAATGAVLGILGLASEAGGTAKVLLFRDNTGGGGPYGPFPNANHFAQSIELSMPAAVVLLVAAVRQLKRRGEVQQRAVVAGLGAAVAVGVATAALLRCGSRGGALFLGIALVAAVPWWLRFRSGRKWPWLVVLVVVAALVVGLAGSSIEKLQQDFYRLLMLEGVDGNSRLDLWEGTLKLWRRAPLVGVGLGAYRHAIALDKPATGLAVLEQAHSDWLEWAASGGLLGVAVLLLAAAAFWGPLRLRRVRRMRFELRYPTAGLVTVLIAASLHEAIGFGLQTPLNRYLAAMWLGLFWGVWTTVERRASRRPDMEHVSTDVAPEASE